MVSLASLPLKRASSGHFGNIPVRPAMSSWPGRAAPSGGKKGSAESIRNVSSSSEPDARSSLAKVSGPINYLEGFYITVGSVRKTAISRVQNLTRMVRITSWKPRTKKEARRGKSIFSNFFNGGEESGGLSVAASQTQPRSCP